MRGISFSSVKPVKTVSFERKIQVSGLKNTGTTTFYGSVSAVQPWQITRMYSVSKTHKTGSVLFKDGDAKTVHERFTKLLMSHEPLIPVNREYKDDRTVLPDRELLSHFKVSVLLRAFGLIMDEKEKDGQAYYSINHIGEESCGIIERGLHAALKEFGVGESVLPPSIYHYRGKGHVLERAAMTSEEMMYQVMEDFVREYFCKTTASNGGRHPLLAYKKLNVFPSTPAIGTQVPQGLGMALSFHLGKMLGIETPFPKSMLSVVSCGDGSTRHPSFLSTLSLAQYYQERRVPVPLLILVTNNDIAISQVALPGETARFLKQFPFPFFQVDQRHLSDLVKIGKEAARTVLNSQQPAIVMVDTARMLGHSRNRRDEHWDIEAVRRRDPLLWETGLLEQRGVLSRSGALELYENALKTVTAICDEVSQEPVIDSVAELKRPLTVSGVAVREFKPVSTQPGHMRRLLTAAYGMILETFPNTVYFGQDVKGTGGHYGVGMGLDKQFPKRVFNFPIDEIGIGAVLNGLRVNHIIGIGEISYNMYTLEGGLSGVNEALLQLFLSPDMMKHGWIMRMPFGGGVKGGPTHNDNSIIERVLPDAKVFCPGSGYSAVLAVKAAFSLAYTGHPVVMKEPTRLYFQTDLFPGDGKWQFAAPGNKVAFEYGDVLVYRLEEGSVSVRVVGRADEGTPKEGQNSRKQAASLCFVTYGNGVAMCLRAGSQLQQKSGVSFTVVEYPSLVMSASLKRAIGDSSHVLIADESRPNGCPGESLFRLLPASGFSGRVGFVSSEDSYNPSGPAQSLALLNDNTIMDAAARLIDGTRPKS